MRIKIAMALMSVIFMAVIAIITNLFHLLPGSDEAVIVEFMSTISLFGSVLFLLEARKELPGWYLAVPFCISLFLLVIVSFWEVSGGELLSGYRYLVTPLVITLLALLSPFSLLVFLSLHGHPYSMKAYLAVSSTASIISIFSLFFAVWEISSRHPQEASFSGGLIAIYLLYWLVVMPVMGSSFLLRAIK
ncbi:hypothetical protein EO95_11775 [Methanosarcina sp. 1.H.T.1A.1]|uniref:hypothetical protein n=1 Tax=Methanosarcina sp. 1.H.T.1A.1 TaxID=1483602 RepID=UPI0006227B47|nr:hypothetical protein [Methanosarcina sp. 1.H.T.1A.1]KKH97836.1 hypothetical protein EO95_11775 [Methanosarcina sp. 1.H.T.1A.1]